MPPGGRNDLISVLDVDPDLGQGLSEEELSAVRTQVRVGYRCHARGRWQPLPDEELADGLGLLVVRGFVVRGLTVAGYTCAELLGPGDLIQPALSAGLEQPITPEIEWTVVQRLHLALLDRAFLARVSSWPQIITALASRLSWRAHLLAFQLALSAQRRTDDRVLLMLWQLAGRWGTVTPEGILLDMPLTHDVLAAAVGARRPSVSAAVGRLVEHQKLRTRPRSRWLLLGAPPDAAARTG